MKLPPGHREAMRAERMKNMPQMVADYREKMRAMRKVRREKNEVSEEKKYLLAVGKANAGPAWQVFINKRKNEQQGGKEQGKGKEQKK